jgi:hypothetical protein
MQVVIALQVNTTQLPVSRTAVIADDEHTMVFHETRLAHCDVQYGGRPVGGFGYQGDIVQFVRLNDGRWVVPIMATEGFLHEGTTKDTRVESPLTPFRAEFSIPVDSRIMRRLFFLKSQNEDSGWRFFELVDLAETVSNDSVPIKLPAVSDLLDLPPTSTLGDEAMLLEKLNYATRKFDQLPGHRKW